MTQAKLHFGEEIRRFTFPEDVNTKWISEKLKELFGEALPAEYDLVGHDSDGRDINLSSDENIRMALAVRVNGLVRLAVVPRYAKAAEVKPEPAVVHPAAAPVDGIRIIPAEDSKKKDVKPKTFLDNPLISSAIFMLQGSDPATWESTLSPLLPLLLPIIRSPDVKGEQMSDILSKLSDLTKGLIKGIPREKIASFISSMLRNPVVQSMITEMLMKKVDQVRAEGQPVEKPVEEKKAAPIITREEAPKVPVELPTLFATLESQTVEDGTSIPVGAKFANKWVISNSGPTAWRPGVELRFERGEQMGAPSAIRDLPTLAPGERCTISVDFVAPTHANKSISYWRLYDPEGTAFGKTIWVDISAFEEESPIVFPHPDPFVDVPVVGSLPAPAPAPVASIYSAQLAQLADMGLTDTARNIALLAKHHGNVEAVANELFA